MKDLGWVQKNLIPHLIDYTIECNYYSEGDFGSLYAITFESSQKGGYIHFWGSGWFGVDVYDYEKDEEVLNVLLEDNEIEDQDQLLEKLKKILLPDME